MEQRITLHIVDSDSRSRAEQARTAFALGHHAEVYSDLAELLSRSPATGVILLRQQIMDRSPEELAQIFGERGRWMPLIVCDEQPRIERVVAALKAGALDYLQLPLEIGRLTRSLGRVIAEAEAESIARRRLTEARRRVVQLSKRERQVLELLSLGSSNKLIARELSISPRTVEIHRANMMTKLRAGHAAEAVRLWLQSGLEANIPARPLEPERDDWRSPEYADIPRERLPGRGEAEQDSRAGEQAGERRGQRRTQSG